MKQKDDNDLLDIILYFFWLGCILGFGLGSIFFILYFNLR